VTVYAGQADPVSGLRLLLLIRNGKAADFASLCRAVGVDPENYSAAYVRVKLNQLEQEGLISRTDDDRYSLTDRWAGIQAALNLSLTAGAALTPGTVVVRPYFGVPDINTAPHDVFVAMPFLESLRPVWEDHIRTAVASVGLSVARADDFFTADSIIRDVWNAIVQSRVMIADCTGRNPNVFYEIGLAHVLGRPVILITQDGEDVPFDLRHIRYIQYQYTPRGMEVFEQRLIETLRTTTKAV
jgi:hypothetical protein